jgi:hypothetical protein
MAMLFYYNEEDGAMEFVESAAADADGNVEFSFVHASDYVIVFGEEIVTDWQSIVGSGQAVLTEDGENADTAESTFMSVKNLSILLLVVAIMAVCVVFIYDKKRK